MYPWQGLPDLDHPVSLTQVLVAETLHAAGHEVGQNLGQLCGAKPGENLA
jgi:hypothetical protein